MKGVPHEEADGERYMETRKRKWGRMGGGRSTHR